MSLKWRYKIMMVRYRKYHIKHNKKMRTINKAIKMQKLNVKTNKIIKNHSLRIK